MLEDSKAVSKKDNAVYIKLASYSVRRLGVSMRCLRCVKVKRRQAYRYLG